MNAIAKLSVFILLVAAGAGVFFFAPLDKIKAAVAKQVQITQSAQKQAPNALPDQALRTKSAPQVVMAPAPVPVTAVDLIFKYLEKFLGMISTSVGLVLATRELKKRRRPTTTPAEPKEEKKPAKRKPTPRTRK